MDFRFRAFVFGQGEEWGNRQEATVLSAFISPMEFRFVFTRAGFAQE